MHTGDELNCAVFDALAFAADRHAGQTRKGARALPYINHPIAVVRILAVEGGVSDALVLAAAALHDTIEDTDTTVDDIASRFGDAIAALVVAVTDDKSLPKAVRKQLQIDHARELSNGARLIKLADKIANVRDMADDPPADWPIERRIAYFEWARAVIDQIRGTDARLEAAFDAAYARKPSRVGPLAP